MLTLPFVNLATVYSLRVLHPQSGCHVIQSVSMFMNNNRTSAIRGIKNIIIDRHGNAQHYVPPAILYDFVTS